MAHNFRTKEETARANRRLRRQALGVLLSVLIVIGLGTVVSGSIRGVAALFDDTKQKEEFSRRLLPLVMLDPLPFGTLEQADPIVLKSAALWAGLTTARENGTLDLYDRDPNDMSLFMPSVDVDAAAAALYGAEYKVTHGTFQDDNLVFEYIGERSSYKIPITGQSGLYSPMVDSLNKKNGLLRVTVGYIPTYTTDEFGISNATEPVKYMDYIFRKKDGVWYLAGLEESGKKVENPPASLPTFGADPMEDPQQQLEQQTASSQPAASEPVSEPAEPADGE